MIKPFFTILTSYSQNSIQIEPFKRLVSSINSSLREIKNNGRLIPLANGISDGAEHPKTISDIFPENNIEIYATYNNIGNCGSLNKTIEIALEKNYENEWIGLIQSSVILSNNFLSKITKAINYNRNSSVFFPKIVSENDPNIAWADGHYFSNNKTYNTNYRNKGNNHNGKSFPCVSCCFVKKSLIRQVVKKYKNFVWTKLKHYGDCTDIALRLLSIDKSPHIFVPNAICTKRWPEINKDLLPYLYKITSKLYKKDVLDNFSKYCLGTKDINFNNIYNEKI